MTQIFDIAASWFGVGCVVAAAILGFAVPVVAVVYAIRWVLA